VQASDERSLVWHLFLRSRQAKNKEAKGKETSSKKGRSQAQKGKDTKEEGKENAKNACFKFLFFTPALSASFRRAFTGLASFPTLKLARMYFRIACRDEPPLSFKAFIALPTISLYVG
jgi:hypothetical protein